MYPEDPRHPSSPPPSPSPYQQQQPQQPPQPYPPPSPQPYGPPQQYAPPQPQPYAPPQQQAYPQSPLAPYAHGVSAPPGPQAPARTRSAKVGILVALVVVLGLVLLGMGAYVAATVSDLRGDISALRTEMAQFDERDAAARSTLEKNLASADLPRKLQAVKDLTDKVEDAAIAWGKLSEAEQNRNLPMIQLAVEACVAAVIAYDQAAGAFPTSMLNGLPPKIDQKDQSTDCLRNT